MTQLLPEHQKLCQKVIDLANTRQVTIGTVESCTGGMLGAWLTSISGSSAVFKGGLITYSNPLKTKLATVSPGLINEYGAVSSEVALAMAEGGHAQLATDITIAITGIAGPQSDDTQKPVGLVHVAIYAAGEFIEQHRIFAGEREEVRTNACYFALNLCLKILENN